MSDVMKSADYAREATKPDMTLEEALRIVREEQERQERELAQKRAYQAAHHARMGY